MNEFQRHLQIIRTQYDVSDEQVAYSAVMEYVNRFNRQAQTMGQPYAAAVKIDYDTMTALQQAVRMGLNDR